MENDNEKAFNERKKRLIKEGELLQEKVRKVSDENEEISRKELMELLKKYDDYILEFPEEVSGYGNRSIVLERLELYELAINDLKKVLSSSDLTLAHLRIEHLFY